jgi:TetR/AcrR family transcriptional regulator, transcriptional repressor of bet genes
MTTTPSSTVTAATPAARKHDERRNQLAESALQTLGELGYARTSLREVAKNSEFSHGVVHYYFQDKLDLIIYCVSYYKAQCVTRYDQVVDEATTVEGLASSFCDKLCETLVEDAPMHRLWYDLRSQAMFDSSLRDAALSIDHALEDMVWRVVCTYARLAGRDLAWDSPSTYAVLDGIFERALFSHLTGRGDACGDLVAQVARVMPLMLAP